MWFKVDDHLHDNGKVRRCDDLAAMGLWTLSGSWVGANGTDGFVPSSVLRRWSSSWRRLSVKLVEANLWTPAQLQGEAGFQFVNWGSWQPLNDQAKLPAERVKWRRAKALMRDRELCEQICQRDRNRCRYCAERVNWKDRRSALSGTYDHVDPEGDNSPGNVVVACRRCNGVKKDRTPEEAGMTLLAVPSRDLAPAKSGQVEDQAGIKPLTGAYTRDRTGQVGAGSGPGSGQVEVGPFDDPVSNGSTNGNGHG